LKKASSIPPRKQTSGGGGVCGFLTGRGMYILNPI
jgi:hypothetical protein